MTRVIGPKRARALLVQHGFDPNADAEALTAAIEARGWHVQVDREPPGNEEPHQSAHWAQAIQPAPPEDLDDLVHLSATGATAQDVLRIVLAKVLVQELAGPHGPVELTGDDRAPPRW